MSSGKAPSGLLAKQRPSPYPRHTVMAADTNDSDPTKQSFNVAGQRKYLTGSRPDASVAPLKELVPVNDLVQLARQAFSQKDFTAALQYLSRALTIAPTDINLLDSRAATFEKLGRLDNALTDAKAMIRNHTQSPKGYLRAGKILRMQQNIRSSAKIYISGAERSTKGTKEYETLARIASEMSAKLDEIAKKEALVLDPMERLPFELVMIVFDSLSFIERVRCLTISKKWMRYLSSVRHFWYSLDLAKRVPSLIRIPQHALYLPTRPDQDVNNKVTNKTVINLAKYTPPKALRLGCAQQISGTLFTQLIKMKRTSALESLSLRMNSRIYDQEFSLFWTATPKLRSLDLHGCFGVTDAAVVSVLDRCSLLEELDISECRITEVCVMVNSTVPLPNMKKLTIGRWESLFAKEGIDALVSRFPNLSTLDIRTMRPRGIEALENICQLTQLKHLYTDSIETSGHTATFLVMQRWVAGIPNLESLQMNACKGVSDATIQLIAAGSAEEGSTRQGWSSSLKMLDLSSSPYLTCQGLSSLSTHPLPHLHTLLLNKCGRVTELGLRQAIASSGAGLCRLECGGYISVSDRLMLDIKDHCPKIEVVHLANSGQVTGIGLMALVNERGRGLERICVDDCPALGVDAVERARVVLGDHSRVSYRSNWTRRQ
ncbi:hypothetical protein BC939DRAFT_457362 [Gamsiella multidivaricata]|uniref:uncharacterized protein n=1 Tax=Gamsiella multidivaricata TaxID=101098 RepID=UPI00221EBCF7|nr:uncharacterized protein BC939DRAFT_457362 [Gamsiella multidivaricata]KAG0369614.1 hypothetical protein BGZ54_009423 [Gamsiella multidivaricata]KAI7820687.1 hypothetical protein BC939DRAFT_457362 [Gamsiella multidivaricata]